MWHSLSLVHGPRMQPYLDKMCARPYARVPPHPNPTQSVNTVDKVYDMYSNFICLESDFFMMREQVTQISRDTHTLPEGEGHITRVAASPC